MFSSRFGAAKLGGSKAKIQRTDEQPPIKRRHLDTSLALRANAFQIRFSAPYALRVYNVKFEGPRQLHIYDENIKRRILTHKTGPWEDITCPKVVQFRCFEGVKLYIMDRGSDKKLMEKISGATILLKSRVGGEEEWKLSFADEHADLNGIRKMSDQPSVWLNFLALVSDAALMKAGFTAPGFGQRVLRPDSENYIRMRGSKITLIPGYCKALVACMEGLYWTFSPRFTVLSERTVTDFLKDLQKSQPHLLDPAKTEELNRELRSANLFAISQYAPSNVYKICGVDYEKNVNSTMEISVKDADGNFQRREVSHLDYLRDRYGAKCTALSDPQLAKDTMIACHLVGRHKQMVKMTRTVHIPGSLLKLCCLNLLSLPREERERVTKESQRSERQTITDIEFVMERLKSPEVQETFQVFGLEVDTSLASAEGRSGATAVTVSVDPVGRKTLIFDQNADFLRDFSAGRRHWRSFSVDANWVLLAKRGRDVEQNVGLFFETLGRTCTEWKLGLQIPEDPGKVPVVFWSNVRELEDVEKKLKARKQSVKLIFGLIGSKNEDDYVLIKQCAYRLQITSQVMTVDVLRRHGQKAMFRLLASLSAKLTVDASKVGPDRLKSFSAPWAVMQPLGSHSGVTAVGIATHLPRSVSRSSKEQNRSIPATGTYGLTLSVDDTCVPIMQDFGVVNTLHPGGIFGDLQSKIHPLLSKLLLSYARPLHTILIYRKGVSASCYDDCAEIELKEIRMALAKIKGAQDWNAEERSLTIVMPEIMKNDTYTLEGAMVTVAADGSRKLTPWKKTAVVNRKLTNNVATVKLDFSDTRTGVPDLRITGIKVTSPSGSTVELFKPPNLVYIIVNKSHGSNLAFFKADFNSSSRGGRFEDAIPAGTVIEDKFMSLDRKGQGRSEFFLIPSTGPKGFATPVNYTILENESQISKRELEEISLRLTFMFFNQFNASKVPHLLRIAELGAENAFGLYRDIVSDQRNILQETYLFL